MVLLLFVIWIILNGKFTLEIALFGIVFSVLLTLFSIKYMDYNIKNEFKMIKKTGLFLKLLAVLFIEIAKSNKQVIYWVFSDRYRMEPALVSFSVDLKKSWSKVILSNFITLTPGTITVLLEDNILSVHCLDKSLAEGIESSSFVKILKELEED